VEPLLDGDEKLPETWEGLKKENYLMHQALMRKEIELESKEKENLALREENSTQALLIMRLNEELQRKEEELNELRGNK